MLMKRISFIFGALIVLVGLSSCHSGRSENVLVSREFPTTLWERFDYVERTLALTKPATYSLELDVAFDDSYAFNYFSMVFTVFDDADHPLRSRNYKFTLKDRDGLWKSEPEEGLYHFRLPLNNELTLNEPGTYTFQIENHMPITPLTGIHKISIISK